MAILNARAQMIFSKVTDLNGNALQRFAMRDNSKQLVAVIDNSL